MFECSIGALIESEPSSTTWRMICPSPVNKSSLVTVNNTLLAVSGRYADEVDSNNIYQYNPNANEWQLVGEMPTPRHYCITALLPGLNLAWHCILQSSQPLSLQNSTHYVLTKKDFTNLQSLPCKIVVKIHLILIVSLIFVSQAQTEMAVKIIAYYILSFHY